MTEVEKYGCWGAEVEKSARASTARHAGTSPVTVSLTGTLQVDGLARRGRTARSGTARRDNGSAFALGTSR